MNGPTIRPGGVVWDKPVRNGKPLTSAGVRRKADRELTVALIQVMTSMATVLRGALGLDPEVGKEVSRMKSVGPRVIGG